jgi:type IV pilus assembly protein PilV
MSREVRALELPLQRAACRGVTLLEVLVALIVLSIGLLGLAGLQTVSLQFSTSAYYRTQATSLAYALVDRMRSGRQAALNDAYNSAFPAPAPACDPNAPAGGTPAQDLAAWRNALACELPLGNGQVVRNGNRFAITVQWDDSYGREAPLEFVFTTAL